MKTNSLSFNNVLRFSSRISSYLHIFPTINKHLFYIRQQSMYVLSLSSCKKRKCNSISRLPPRSSFTFFCLLTISKENLQVFQTCITAQHLSHMKFIGKKSSKKIKKHQKKSHTRVFQCSSISLCPSLLRHICVDLPKT